MLVVMELPIRIRLIILTYYSDGCMVSQEGTCCQAGDSRRGASRVYWRPAAAHRGVGWAGGHAPVSPAGGSSRASCRRTTARGPVANAPTTSVIASRCTL